MRVVLDTNVLIAAFATRGLCEDVLRTVLAEHQLVASEHILDELERVLSDKLKMPTPKVRAVTVLIRQSALIIEPEKPAAWPTNDPDDQWITATAIHGEAQVLVSGDRDLSNPPEGLPLKVYTPREFWESLR